MTDRSKYNKITIYPDDELFKFLKETAIKECRHFTGQAIYLIKIGRDIQKLKERK